MTNGAGHSNTAGTRKYANCRQRIDRQRSIQHRLNGRCSEGAAVLVHRRTSIWKPSCLNCFVAGARYGCVHQSGHPQFHLRAPEHLQGAGLVGHVFLRDLEISVSLEPSTLPPPDCANNALFRSMWRHCDGRRYADRPLGAGGTQCELYVLWQS